MENQKQKKSGGLVALVVLLLIVTIVSAILATYAWSKYQSAAQGSTDAVVAQWNIDFVAGQAQYNYDYVVGQKIAPGTSGHFDIAITGNSEVAFEYIVRLTDIKNKPKNLKFYIKKAGATAGTSVPDTFENRTYFDSTFNNVRTDSRGSVIPDTDKGNYTGTNNPDSTVEDKISTYLRNNQLNDSEISDPQHADSAASTNVYTSKYTEANKLEIHWVWPYNAVYEDNTIGDNGVYNQRDGMTVDAGNVSNDIAGNSSKDNYLATHLVSEYDQDDVFDGNRIGNGNAATGADKMSFTVTIVATQIRPSDPVLNNSVNTLVNRVR